MMEKRTKKEPVPGYSRKLFEGEERLRDSPKKAEPNQGRNGAKGKKKDKKGAEAEVGHEEIEDEDVQ